MPHPRMYSDDDPHLDGVRRVCLALPEAVEVEAWGWPSFRAGAKGKMFAIYDNHADGAYALTFKADQAERAALMEDKRFFEPWLERVVVACKAATTRNSNLLADQFTTMQRVLQGGDGTYAPR